MPGAVCPNEDHWNEMLPAIVGTWTPDRKIVVYCKSQSCSASHAVARRLRDEAGFTEVFVLKGGWEAWVAAQK